MRAVTTAEMLACEDRALARGRSAEELMERAGAGIARLLRDWYGRRRDCLLLAGKGNNGGDALVAARYLIAAGWRVRVEVVVPEAKLTGLPQQQLARLRGLRGGPQEAISFATPPDLIEWPDGSGLVVDGLLGIGAKGKLRGEVSTVVGALNAARRERFFRVVALDLPTGAGVWEDEEAPPAHDDETRRDEALIADWTLCIGYPKAFLLREELANWVGRLDVIPIFETSDAIADASTSAAPAQSKAKGAKQVVKKAAKLAAEARPLTIRTAAELAPLLPRRRAQSHKNSFGRALIIGGSPGFHGACVLAALSACRAGAGLVNVLTHRETLPQVAALLPPEVMVRGLEQGDELQEMLDSASAVAIGPGFGTDRLARDFLAWLIPRIGAPMVLDADALTCLAAQPKLLESARGRVILTPHPGEMKRLAGGTEVAPSDRPALAREWSDRHGVTLVLKGVRTLVATPGHDLFVNTTGNPALATGGSGDTLTGLLAALLAQKLSIHDAACFGVWWHGAAADGALFERGCEEGVMPTDVAASLGRALQWIRHEAAASAVAQLSVSI